MSPTLPHHLQQSQVYTGSDSVMVGNGEYLPITHTGSTSLASTSGTIHVSDVLVCPKITKSVLSLSKITSDYPCSIDFDCDNVRIYDKGTKRLLLQGPHTSGLYSLRSSSPQVFYSNRQISVSDEVWHQRLGTLIRLFFNSSLQIRQSSSIRVPRLFVKLVISERALDYRFF